MFNAAGPFIKVEKSVRAEGRPEVQSRREAVWNRLTKYISLFIYLSDQSSGLYDHYSVVQKLILAWLLIWELPQLIEIILWRIAAVLAPDQSFAAHQTRWFISVKSWFSNLTSGAVTISHTLQTSSTWTFSPSRFHRLCYVRLLYSLTVLLGHSQTMIHTHGLEHNYNNGVQQSRNHRAGLRAHTDLCEQGLVSPGCCPVAAADCFLSTTRLEPIYQTNLIEGTGNSHRSFFCHWKTKQWWKSSVLIESAYERLCSAECWAPWQHAGTDSFIYGFSHQVLIFNLKLFHWCHIPRHGRNICRLKEKIPQKQMKNIILGEL